MSTHREVRGLQEGQGRVKGAECDEVLYADDPVLVAQDEDEMNTALHVIEEGARIGLKLNKGTREALTYGAVG